jgi:hypothetical protein
MNWISSQRKAQDCCKQLLGFKQGDTKTMTRCLGISTFVCVWLSVFTADAETPKLQHVQAHSQQFVLVSHSDVILRKTLNKHDIRRMASGRARSWSNGKPIKWVFPPRNSLAMRWFCSSYLGVPEEIFQYFLVEMAFRGNFTPPTVAKSLSEVASIVAQTADAMGIIRTSDLNDKLKAIRLTTGK